jgi:uncharacterized protein (DUF1501 family)
MRRREFIATASALSAFALLPAAVHAKARALGWRTDRSLVLIELAGGNDGLNMIVPYADPAYHRLRPRIGIKRDAVVQLDERMGLHPALAPLRAAWTAGDVAIVQGVGYSHPNRSHFRSTDIWETGSDSDRVLTEGWLARALAPLDRPRDRLADAVVLGGGTGPVAGDRLRAVTMTDPQRFLNQSRGMRAPHADSVNPALAHIIFVEHEIADTAKELRQVLARAPQVIGDFPKGRFGHELSVAARVIAAGAVVPVYKLALGSFDTHVNQPGRQEQLLRQLGQGLAAFRTALAAAGRWDKVMVMTYSEFGRRVAENGSNGTDHGTAAPHFVIGGTVKGGLYGSPPNLADLDAGDLRYAIDYRRLYATAVREWWQVKTGSAASGDHRPLAIVKG